jgi:hypothetical protein
MGEPLGILPSGGVPVRPEAGILIEFLHLSEASPILHHQVMTTFPNVSLLSSDRCASASSVMG